MLPKKYHAIAFFSILVMLLLLGLHLLGFGFLGSGGQAGGPAPRTAAALARNSTSSNSSLLAPMGASSTLNPNAVYRHPIVYDKITGATNNEINEVLGGPASKQDQYPLDHYQQQSQQLRNRNPFDPQFGGVQEPANPPSPFGNHLLGQFEPPPPGHHHAAMHPPRLAMGPRPPHLHHQLPPPPPPPPPQSLSRYKQHVIGAQPLHASNQAATSATAAAEQRQPQQQQQHQQQQDSIPSASSVNNNGATQPSNATRAQYYQQQQQQPQHPVYYTPPIFTYGNLDPAQHQPQVPPLSVPEVPLSVDEYNARQGRLRQLNNQQHQASEDPATKQQVNLLADPQAQQRHKQQMLERQLLFGPPSLNNQPLAFMPPPSPPIDNYTAAAYYPDPALHAMLQQQQHPPSASSSIRPPYAHQVSSPPQTQLEAPTQLARSSQHSKQLPPQGKIIGGQRPSSPLAPQHQRPQPVVAHSLQSSTVTPPTSVHDQLAPTCARKQLPVNSTSQPPVLFCNEDSEYPTLDIMRALEQHAVGQSIEQILPQQLIRMLMDSSRAADLQRQLLLDSLQATSNFPNASESGAGTQQGLFPTSNYDSLCKSVTWMAQPRRAKNLGGQWKVIVNLPGHKYRGIAISQIVHVDECSQPNEECSLGPVQPATLSKSRCLQHYNNQRLLAWSNQQGLHIDTFRFQIGCSCHMRRI